MLPRVKPEMMDAIRASLASVKEGEGGQYLSEQYGIILKENPTILQVMMNAISTCQTDREIQYVILSTFNTYFLLRGQAEADELEQQWGD